MDPQRRRELGRTGVEITAIGLGGTGLGNIYSAVEEEAALETVAAAHGAGVRFFDTAPAYGNGLSELRMGRALAGHARDELAIASKVGYSLVPLQEDEEPWDRFEGALPFRSFVDFSREAILRSLEQSLERLGTDRLDVVWMHDPDEGLSMEPDRDPDENGHFATAMDEAYPSLDELRGQGVIGALGVGMNGWEMLEDFARAGDFDCFLLANRYTLLEQGPIESFLPLCASSEIGVVIGGPFSSGILATGAVEGARYRYEPATAETMERVRDLERVAAYHGVALPAAALQFPFGHPAVAAVIPGARSPEELRQNCAFLEQPIPGEFWAELKQLELIDPAAPVPEGAAP